MNMVRLDVSPAVYSLLQDSQPTSACIKRRFFHAAKTVSRGQKVYGRKCKRVHDFTFPFLHLGDCRVGCLYKACVLQVFFRICVFSLFKCSFQYKNSSTLLSYLVKILLVNKINCFELKVNLLYLLGQ